MQMSLWGERPKYFFFIFILLILEKSTILSIT